MTAFVFGLFYNKKESYILLEFYVPNFNFPQCFKILQTPVFSNPPFSYRQIVGLQSGPPNTQRISGLLRTLPTQGSRLLNINKPKPPTKESKLSYILLVHFLRFLVFPLGCKCAMNIQEFYIDSLCLFVH